MLPSDSAALLRRNRELSILNHIAETLNRTSDIQVALDETLDSLVELMGQLTGRLFVLDDGGKLYIAAYHALPPAMEYPGRSWIGGCDCNTLFKSGELRTAVNIVRCSRLAGAKGDRQGLQVHASAPLSSAGRMLGILNVASPGEGTFTPDTLLLLSAVGAQLGTAIARVWLSRRAVTLAALEERNRIAREIHDTLAQGLAAIALHLEAAQALEETKPAAVPPRIEKALQLARTNLDEARRSVLDLRASALAGRTLPEALRLLAGQFAAEASLPVQTLADPHIGRLPAAVETGLYRIAQEALNNVAKHARPAAVTITLRRLDETIRLTIEDNGTGFDPEAVQPTATGGVGIVGMRERAHLLDGHLEVSSAPGGGTRITAVVPLQENP
jgi:two-component system NarL family sensor kinase